ncbi:MAG: SoxR reducing system RseC family protein [Candidatus Accumulibacter sp.]|jgi:sigma-E factor negative regulatory protein RseC|nr:SoxR reducing system RseC family protein [Accumulibacter sp.]
MIDSTATVTALDGDCVVVRIDDAGCGHCHEEGGCGSHRACAAPRTFRLPNPGGASVGDRVTILLPDGNLWRSALLAYGTPLAFVFFCAFVGERLGGEPLAILMAFCGLIFSFVCLKPLSRRAGTETRPFIRD